MHYLVSHSFFSLDLIPQSMQLFQTVWNMGNGKPDLEMMVFSMHLFHLEIKSEWQLEQHFEQDYLENMVILQIRHKMQLYFQL